MVTTPQESTHGPGSRSHRPATRWAVIAALTLAAGVLAACDLPGRAATPVPTVQMQAYQPGAALPAATALPAVEAPAAPALSLAAPVSAAAAGDGRLGYTGEVLAKDQVRIMPEVPGRVLQVNAEVGDHVQAGDTLLQIDSAALEAQRAQALAALEAAQSQLDLLTIEPKDADLEAARAGVAAADAAYKRALEGPTAEDLAMAEAQLRQAEARVKQAQAAYDNVAWNPLIAALPESLQLEQATLALETAQAQYDKTVKGATDDVIAQAYAQLAASRAQLQRLEDGPEDAQIRAAESQVRQAETALYLAQLQLDKAAVRAPMDGIIASVDTAVGAMAAPGAPAFTLLSEGVEIAIPVEEPRMAELRVGQPARIRVDAYPDRVIEGAVAIIAPQLDATTRTVRVIIRPTGDATGLAPGMFATVELDQ